MEMYLFSQLEIRRVGAVLTFVKKFWLGGGGGGGFSGKQIGLGEYTSFNYHSSRDIFKNRILLPIWSFLKKRNNNIR